jgi:outer membrane protein, multidrug efflux system
MIDSTALHGLRTSERLRVPRLAAATLTLAGTLLLAACNLGPHYARPEIPAPATWTPVAAESTPTGPRAPEDNSWPDPQWWHGFGSPELDRLIAQAQLANDDLKAAVARVQQSDAQVRIAGAPLLPSLGAGFTPTRSRQILPMGAGTALTSNTFTASLTAGYELDFWGRNAALRAAAVAQATGSRYDR